MFELRINMLLVILIAGLHLPIIGIYSKFADGPYLPTKGLDEKKYPNLVQFIKFFRCPKEIEDNKKEHFLKGSEYDRIINAERLRKVIQQHDLYKLEIPKKCLCDIGGKLHVLSMNVNRVDPKDDLKWSKEDEDQMKTFVELTGFTDGHSGNIGKTKEGNIAIWDTENISFHWRDSSKLKKYSLKGIDLEKISEELSKYEENHSQ